VFTIEDGRFKESTGQMMLDIINEPSRHKVMREYTLQYTVDFFEKHWKNSPLSSKPTKLKLASVSDQNLQKQFIKTMWNMLDSADGPIAGTSLIRLHDIGKSFSIVDQDKLADKIQRIVTDDLAADSTKMAALSLAAERQQINLADSAMNIAVDNSLNLPLRMSALHTASQLNSSSDFINRIRRLSNDNASHRILRRAAQQILNKLNTTRG
ncbi:MAG: hypothetical protein MK132_27485, partial [Lentisphaerales bacterium]|nr:hypothetical protein [Lentisphaerales bacterium]